MVGEMNSAPEGTMPLQAHATTWSPSNVKIALNLTLNACMVPTAEEGGLRLDAGHVVVLDDLLDPASCESIRSWLGVATPPSTVPPSDRWERCTADGVDGATTYGLKDSALHELESSPPAGILELNSRLLRLFPDVHIVHQFSQQGDGHTCERYVANAAVAGDVFAWHLDADPSSMPPPFGGYVNRERGKPLYVSAVLYLDADWPVDFGAESLFLDPPTGTGVFIRPKAGRVVLMDQDVPHRLSPPAACAGRPRYSLVWKLLFCPRDGGQRCCIARPEWGRPIPFGSDARVAQLRRDLQLRRESQAPRGRKRAAEEPPMTEPRAKAGPSAAATHSGANKRRRESGEAQADDSDPDAPTTSAAKRAAVATAVDMEHG